MSKYNFDFDWQEIPGFMQSRIINFFDQETFFKEDEYDKWKTNLEKYVDTIPEEKQIIALEKGIEYGEKCLDWHIKNECHNVDRCPINESWTRRNAIAKKHLKSLQTFLNTQSDSNTSDKPTNKEFTTARQVLAMHYIFEYMKVKNVDNSEKARFIEFLTGKNYKNIYDAVRDPITSKKGLLRKEDLIFIRGYFQKLGLLEIIKMIENEIDIPE